MLIRRITPMLHTADLPGTIDFYTNVLGFSLNHFMKSEEGMFWCRLEKELGYLMFSLYDDEAPKLTGTLYIYVSDVEGLWERVKDKCTVLEPICEKEYEMKDFTICDNNGYSLMFGNAVKPSDAYERYFPPTFTLETPRVELRLMRPADIDAYLNLKSSDETWKYFVTELNTRENMQEWMDQAFEEMAMKRRVAFTIADKDTKEICGSTSYGNISFYDKRLEIGWSWLSDAYRGSGVNKNAKFALLSYAFDVMKMERVEIKTDNLNDRAKAALLKVGMIPEGVLRSHMQMHHDRRRDTIYFSLLREEWRERREQFFAEMI